MNSSTNSSAPAPHNRVKNYLVPADRPFLRELGITNQKNEVRYEMYDKFRQINKFVEILDSLLRQSTESSPSAPLRVVDFGSGKNYLTFALYDYWSHVRKIPIQMQGIEQRAELVKQGNHLAKSSQCTSLHFVEGKIAAATALEADVVIALHACDTATDDALVQALHSQAKIIAVAPCCHKYVRGHFSVPEDLKPVYKHGILEERLAESLTDGLRALFLESHNYQTKVFEFIALEHTAKNVMISACKTQRPAKINATRREQIAALKSRFGLRDFYLDRTAATG